MFEFHLASSVKYLIYGLAMTRRRGRVKYFHAVI